MRQRHERFTRWPVAGIGAEIAVESIDRLRVLFLQPAIPLVQSDSQHFCYAETSYWNM